MTSAPSGEQPFSTTTETTTAEVAWARLGARLAARQLDASIGFVARVRGDSVEVIGLDGAAVEAVTDWLPSIWALAGDLGVLGGKPAARSVGEGGLALVGSAFALADPESLASPGSSAVYRGVVGGIGTAPMERGGACLADLAQLLEIQAAGAADLAQARAEAAAGAFRERRLRAALDALPQNFWMTDGDGRYIEQNAKDRQVFGDLVGHAAHEVDPPLEQASRWRDQHRRVLAGETLHHASWRRQPDGEGERYIESAMAPLVLDGAIAGTVGLTTDRTEQATIERRLAESEGRLKAALDALPFAFFICDAEGRHVMQNSLDRELWGDAIGKTHAELDIPPELAAYVPEVTAGVLGGKTSRSLLRYPMAGQMRDIEEIYAPVYARGEVSGFVGIAIDHTDRVATERRLAESEARLKAALDALPYPFYIYDTDGRLAMANRVDRAIWGDCTGRHFEEIGLPAGVLPSVREAFAQAVAGQSSRCQLRFEMAGRLVDVEVVSAPIQAGGRISGVVGLVIDHTDRVAAERRLRQSEARLKAVIDALPCALFVCDLDGRHLLQNSVDRDLWGDCVGKTYAELDLPEEIKQQVPAIIERVRAGRSMRAEIGYDQGGMRREIEETYAPVYDEGKVAGFVGLAIDHTDRLEAERGRRLSEARLADYLATASDWLWEADAEHRITALDGWRQCDAIPAALLIGKRRWELAGADPASDPSWRGYYADVVARRPIRGFVYAYPSADRAEVWIEVSGNPVFDDAGEFQGYRGTARDVSERCRAEAALREAHARIETLSASGLIGIIAGRGFIIEEANDAFLRLVGRDSSDLAAGLDWRLLRPEEVREQAVAEALERRPKGSFHAIERDFARPDGSRVPALLSIVSLDGDADRWFALVQDLTAMKAAEERVRELAERDVLTGLANRHVLFERLKGDLDERRRPGALGALLMLDLDNFKEVNDSLGHEAGDRVLQTVATRLSAVIRDSDTIARLGGDEFALVLRRLGGPVAAAEVAEKLLGALAQPFELEGREIRPKASIGVALFPGDGTDAAELLRKADIALYQAKARGRGTFCFFAPALLAGLERRRRIAQALEASVLAGRFDIALQPQLDLASGAVAGVEALVRWQLDGEPVEPEAFIAIAVESGSIVPMGRIVRGLALEAWQRCERQGLTPGRIAVNVAAAELKQPGFADELADLLAATGVPPDRLEIEVTESALFDRDAETVAATLGELRHQGIIITLDDFGTGYASLTHLKRFPVDRLKIDRSFVRDIGGGHDPSTAVDADLGDAVIVRSIIDLAHTLGLTVVAEGVETAAQEAFLKHHRCDLAQGFRFAEPLAPAELERYLARAARCGMAPSITAE